MRIPPIAESDAQEKLARTLQRIKELLGTDAVPEPFLVMANVEAFAQDFYMNFKKFVFNDGPLDAKTKSLIGIAVSSHYGSSDWLDYYSDRLLSLEGNSQQIVDAIAVAATCGMYNSFFKFRELSGLSTLEGLPVGLRAHTFMNTSLDEQTTEIINIAISNLNACRPCVSGHVEAIKKMGLSDDQLLEIVQCAGTVAAGCSFLKAAKS